MPNGCFVYQHKESNKQVTPLILCCACLNITISENILLDFRLIEEFMLLANMAVARKIQRAFPETSLLRRHPKPKQRCADILVTYSSYPVCRMHVHTIRTDLWYHDLRIGYFVRINGISHTVLVVRSIVRHFTPVQYRPQSVLLLESVWTSAVLNPYKYVCWHCSACLHQPNMIHTFVSEFVCSRCVIVYMYQSCVWLLVRVWESGKYNPKSS